MTADDFTAFYPQFADFRPPVVLASFLAQANARFSDFEEDTDEARRLYLAHKLTLYAAAALPENSEFSYAALSASGEKKQAVTSKKVGEVAIGYSAPQASSLSSSLADLAETVFGLQLLALIRAHGCPVYVR